MADYDSLRQQVEADAGDFTSWSKLLAAVEEGATAYPERVAPTFESFLAKFPLCFGYWCKYADLQRRLGEAGSVDGAEAHVEGLSATRVRVERPFRRAEPWAPRIHASCGGATKRAARTLCLCRARHRGLASAGATLDALGERCAALLADPGSSALFLSIALWGNRMDLSLWPAGANVAASAEAFDGVLDASQKQLLADDTPAVLALLDNYKGERYPPSLHFDLAVQWGDMDALAHLNNVQYFVLFEHVRCAFFDSVGLSLDGSMKRGPILKSTWKKPASPAHACLTGI